MSEDNEKKFMVIMNDIAQSLSNISDIMKMQKAELEEIKFLLKKTAEK